MRNLTILGMGLLLTGLIACKKNSYPYKDVVYITAAEVTTSTVLTVDGGTAELPITVKSSGLVHAAVTATLATDTTLIANYNLATGKHFSALPTNSYKLSSPEVTIAAGTSISDAIKLQILSDKNFKEGVSYIVPVTIRQAGGSSVLEASKTLYVMVNRVIISTVASLTGTSFKVDFSKNNDALKAMRNLTYEAKIKVNKFQASSPFISSIMGIEENFLLRFGDVTVKPNQLQSAGGATAVNVPMEFATDKWYHIAAIYDGSKMQIYVDGAPVTGVTASRTFDITQNFYFGYSANGRYLDGAISEARVWSRALTSSELINGMCGIDPASPGLVGYWKFNEGTGNIAHDISGNNHDATANRAITWIPNVRCN